VDRKDSGKCKWHRAFFWLRLLGVEEPCRLYVGAAESVVPQPRVGNEVHEVRSAWRLQVSNASVNQPQRTRTYFLWSCSVPPPAHGTRRVLEHTSTLRRAVRVDRGRLEVPVTPRRSRYPFFSSFFRGHSTHRAPTSRRGPRAPSRWDARRKCALRQRKSLYGGERRRGTCRRSAIERVVWNSNWIDLEVER
jgi:hypothetical protein